MNEVTIIVGLPGSGKSYFGRRLSKELDIPFFDDCGTDENSWSAAVARIKSGGNCIVADPKLCSPNAFDSLLSKINELISNYVLHVYYFSNEPEVCIKNLQGRDSRIVSSTFVRHLSSKYRPIGRTTPCYRKKMS